MKSALLTPSKVIWRRFVIHRWIFSWTTSPLNPLAAEAGTFDIVLISGRSSSGAAAPGEIPGERRTEMKVDHGVKYKTNIECIDKHELS